MKNTVPSALLIALAIQVAGCTSPQSNSNDDVEVAWSTKNQIAREPDRGLRKLVVDEVTSETVAALRDSAVHVLEQATSSTNALLRANAIEALQFAPDHIQEPLRAALRDENRGVRFVAAMTVGQLAMTQTISSVEPLLRDESDSVRAAAIFAMIRCDQPVDRSPLGTMIVSDDLEVRGNAAMILGEIGDPNALTMLRDALQQSSVRRSIPEHRRVELQVAEAMFKLRGAEEDIQVIRAALFTSHDQGEITAMACQILGGLDDQAYRSALIDKSRRMGRRQESAEIRIAAAAAVARMTPDEAPIEPVMSYVGASSYALRAQTAHALGFYRDREVRPTLTTMLNDPNALVQVTAAGAILRGFPAE